MKHAAAVGMSDLLTLVGPPPVPIPGRCPVKGDRVKFPGYANEPGGVGEVLEVLDSPENFYRDDEPIFEPVYRVRLDIDRWAWFTGDMLEVVDE